MKHVSKALLTLSLVATAPAVLAADPQFYATADVGMARQSSEWEAESDTSFSLGAGYQIDANWSLNANYFDYGNSAFIHYTLVSEQGTYNVSESLDVMGLGLFAQYMTERRVGDWSAGARLGMVYWDAKLNADSISIEDSTRGNSQGTDSGVGLSWGFISNYALMDNWDLSFGADFMHYSVNMDPREGKVDMLRWSIGMKYYF